MLHVKYILKRKKEKKRNGGRKGPTVVTKIQIQGYITVCWSAASSVASSFTMSPSLRAPSSNMFLPLSYLFFLVSFLSGVQSDDRQLLLPLKSALHESNSPVFDSWNSTNPTCHFHGITCNSDGSVTEIDLSSKNLSGILPFDSICQLPSLQKLSFGFNSLQGKVAEDLRNCVNLVYLDLGNNDFSGPFPDVSPLNRLQYLFLNQSGFSGTFPWKSLLNMTRLVRLSVGDNPFQRTPFPTEVVHLTNLQWLYLSNCSLEGEIPAGIGNLTELVNLEFSDNFISGEIPSEIGNLRKLWQFEFYNNLITGKFPIGFRNLTSLVKLDGSMNQLEGDLSELRFLTNLVSLQLFENKLTGVIPPEFGEFKELVNLSLYTNYLKGSIPQKLGSWAEFDFIDVSENMLTGPIPPDMCGKGKMRELLVLQNKLSGEIPVTYEKCTTMIRFRVNDNLLSGTVPSGIWGLPNAEIIDVELNRLEGSITSDIKNAKALATLHARKNRLSGEIPKEISEATSMVTIDLSENQFSGKIPSGIGKLKSLSSLHLQSNRLSGSIPDSLGSCTYLSDIELAKNSLSGNIPSSLGHLPALNALNLSQNELSGEIPASFTLLRLSLFDLSNNRLTGPIPQSLSIQAFNGSLDGNPGLCTLDGINTFRPCSPHSSIPRNVRTLIICFTIALIMLLACLALYMKLNKREEYRERSLKEESWDLKSFHVLSFTEDEILDSIKQENLIGKGGSGNVYRVLLSNGKELAVKHIWNMDSAGWRKSRTSTPMIVKLDGKSKSKEFDAEVQTLSSIRHVNVVKLYCSITSEDSSLLVYEYLPNGSLWDRLHTSGKMELDWEKRYEIAVGAAKGLEYLHHGCVRPVIHRDVKSSNILLDEFMKPRIADFGLAKIVQPNIGQDSTQVIAGTHGYIAPEYAYTYKVNEKSDVYSFGVVLMELITGKKPIEAEYGENKDIVSWVCSKMQSQESIMSVVDCEIPDMYKEEAVKMLRIAILCTTRLPALRPTMRSVVQMLEDAEPCKLVGILISKDGSEKAVLRRNSCELFS
ncbi:receptor-like protein kinase 7 [Prosopis cineraria]|uniref:receptor-like protein kinase 7 n=1 Tax=Prosopis cineraria TaxID=364024 RepID=UPI002410AAE2|nr:receptor-like protein kinase 7 [Prosopis cineraria]